MKELNTAMCTLATVASGSSESRITSRIASWPRTPLNPMAFSSPGALLAVSCPRRWNSSVCAPNGAGLLKQTLRSWSLIPDHPSLPPKFASRPQMDSTSTVRAGYGAQVGESTVSRTHRPCSSAVSAPPYLCSTGSLSSNSSIPATVFEFLFLPPGSPEARSVFKWQAGAQRDGL